MPVARGVLTRAVHPLFPEIPMGNRAILSSIPGGYGTEATVGAIDANSRSEGGYSVERTINDEHVFLAPEDAARLDAELTNNAGDRQYAVVPQGHTWERVADFAQDFFRGLVQR